MVTTKQLELHELLEKGINQASELGKPIITSQVMMIESIDPLLFFHNATTLYKGNRMYWSDTEGLHIIGIGRILELFGNLDHRFDDIHQQWQSHIENALIDGTAVRGTGLLLMGGSTFDPNKQKGKTWKNFPDAGFGLPQFILTQNNTGTWLTINELVHPNDHSEQKAQDVLSHLDTLLNRSRNTNKEHTQGMELAIQETSPELWLEAVREMANEIKLGKMEKVVLARDLHVEGSKDFSPTAVLKNLNAQQTDSFIFAFERNETCFLGATPERLIKKDQQMLYTTCLAGSIARGKTPTEDAELGEFLLNDKKNLQEHQFVVDMITSAMNKVCHKIEVPDQPTLYKVRDIQHLYTPIIGHTYEEASLFNIIKDLHPTPALGGVPRHYALEKIRELEPQDRGWYASPIGWIDQKGNGEFAVAIRSGVIEGNHATLFAGCGIVGDSNPVSEYEETKIKFKPMLSGIGGNI